ncbi:MAG: hypothetical protein AAB074_06475 [Planctomycetota bacterium]
MIRLASVPALPDSPSYPDAGLDGIEAMAGPDNRAHAPAGTVGLRLTLPLCWREAWLGLPEAAQLMTRVPTRDEMVEHLAAGIDEARRLRVKYVAIRASHGTPEGILTGRHGYTDYDVLMALAEWLFLAMGERDQGFEVLFENTWHAGLRWNEPKLAQQLLDKIRHPRVAFSLDVGAWLLVSGGTQTETADLRRLKNFAKTLGPIAQRFRALVMRRPANAPVASDLVKKVRATEDPSEKLKIAAQYDAAVDAHQPWVSAQLKELVEIVQPAYVIHRLKGEGAKWAEMVRRQDGLVT